MKKVLMLMLISSFLSCIVASADTSPPYKTEQVIIVKEKSDCQNAMATARYEQVNYGSTVGGKGIPVPVEQDVIATPAETEVLLFAEDSKNSDYKIFKFAAIEKSPVKKFLHLHRCSLKC